MKTLNTDDRIKIRMRLMTATPAQAQVLLKTLNYLEEDRHFQTRCVSRPRLPDALKVRAAAQACQCPDCEHEVCDDCTVVGDEVTGCTCGHVSG